MSFISTEKIKYHTKLSKNEIINNLKEITDLDKKATILFSNKPTKAYEGTVNDDSFSIKRALRKRNSFLPVISGTITDTNSERIIEIEMSLSKYILNFLFIWFAVVGFGFSYLVITSIINHKFDPSILTPLLGFVFVYILNRSSFKTEIMQTKKFLQKIFKAEIK